MKKIITDQAAINIFKKLIADRVYQFNNTPAFLNDERDSLIMEIEAYEADLRRLRGK